MRVLVSYPLIHEVLLNRPGFVEEADKLWELMRSGKIQGYMTQRGLDIILLDLLDSEGENKAEKIVSQIKEVVGICTVNRTIREQAQESNLDYDFAIELACAIDNGFDAIVTQHFQGFNGDDLVMTVKELLDQQRGESISLETINQLNDTYYNDKPRQLAEFHPLEVERYLTYRIRSSIATALKVFEIIKEKGSQGITCDELAIQAQLSKETTNSVVLDLHNFHIAFINEGRIVAQPPLFKFEREKVIDYLAETLKKHIVTQEVYKQVNPGKYITRCYLQELIANVSQNEKSIIPKTSSDYISRMLPWFFFTGLLEDRGNGIIARPTEVGKGKQRGKLKEDNEVQQLELFAGGWNSAPNLVEANAVEVSVISQKSSSHHRSALELLDELPGQRLFKTPEEADKYLQEERSAWEN